MRWWQAQYQSGGRLVRGRSPLPKGLFAPNLEKLSGRELTSLVWGKAKALYGEEPPQIVVDRNIELDDILGRKYDVIYMSAQKLVQDSLDRLSGGLPWIRGLLLVAFMSGITRR